MKEFSLRTRQRDLEQAADVVSDVAVIGGGITGAGVAREAALNGWRVILLEKGDFASGTSSRSSKLVHGGVRYLAQGDIALVKEAARERAVLRRIAPHLVTPVRMLIPVGSQRAKIKLAAGLWTFDRLAGAANDAHVVLAREDVLAAEPGLRTEHVAGGVAYTEYITDDARLTLETVKTAAMAGARVAHYAEVVGIEEAGDQRLLLVDDRISGGRLVVRARCVVNAAGPWFDRVRTLSTPDAAPLVQLTRGIHLVFRRARLPVDHAVVLRAPDGRSTFVVPKGEYAYVGTTDTLYDGAPEEPGITKPDARYLLECLRGAFHDPPGPEDVVGTWSGVRPLLRQDARAPSEISRRDEVHVGPGPIVAVAGGKLTTYRCMAERVIKNVVGILGAPATSRVNSAAVPLLGGDVDAQRAARGVARSLDDSEMEEHLWSTYGVAAGGLVEGIARGGEAAERVGSLPLTRAELDFAVEYEMVANLDDLLRRRTSVGQFDIERATDAAAEAARLLGARLGWTANRIREEVASFAADRSAELRAARSGEEDGSHDDG